VSYHVLKHSVAYFKGEMVCVLYLLGALLNQHNPCALENGIRHNGCSGVTCSAVCNERSC